MRSTGLFTSVRAAIYKRQLITYHNQTDKILISFHVSQIKVANNIQAGCWCMSAVTECSTLFFLYGSVFFRYFCVYTIYYNHGYMYGWELINLEIAVPLSMSLIDLIPYWLIGFTWRVITKQHIKHIHAN